MKKRFVIFLVAFLSVLSVAYAITATAESYRLVGAAPTSYRSNVAAVDSTDWGVPIDPKRTNGNRWVAIQPSFANASDFALIQVGLYQNATGGFMGISSVTTASAGTHLGEDNYFLPVETAALPIVVDTRGAVYFDVRVVAVGASPGVDLTAWTFGAASGAVAD